MDREYTAGKVPDRLTRYLETSSVARAFRRRAVLAKVNGEWSLVCCVVEGFPSEGMPAATLSRSYRQAILYEVHSRPRSAWASPPTSWMAKLASVTSC
jgi:hypothetical protein